MLLIASAYSSTCLSILDNAQGLTTDNYADLARLGEIYRTAAECFQESNEEELAYSHYLQAGNYYFNASEQYDVAGDYDKQMIWYMTAGDMYREAGRKDLAKEAYDKAGTVYKLHSSEIPGNLSMELQMRIYKLEHPQAENYESARDYANYVNYISVSVAALILIIIVVMLFYLRK